MLRIMAKGGFGHWAKRIDLMEEELANMHTSVHSLQIQSHGLSSQVLTTMEELVQQKKGIHFVDFVLKCMQILDLVNE
jgi:hypothetical protein